MPWMTITWVGVAGYVVGAPLIWHIEQWWLDRKLREFRWIYHLCFFTAVAGSYFAYTWWVPPLFLLGLVIASGLVQVVAFEVCRLILSPLRVRHGISAGSPWTQDVQLKREIEIEARRRGLDMNKPISDQTPDERAKLSELTQEYENRLHQIGWAMWRRDEL